MQRTQTYLRTTLAGLCSIALLCAASMGLAQTVLYSEQFNSITQNQSISAPPFNWTVDMGYVGVGQVSRPGWQGGGIVGTLATGGINRAHRPIAGIPTTGVVCMSFDTWADSGVANTTGEAGFGPGRIDPAAVNQVVMGFSSSYFDGNGGYWYFDARDLTGGANDLWWSPRGWVWTGIPVRAKLVVDYDQHTTWGELWSGSTLLTTTPSFAFAGAIPLQGIATHQDRRWGAKGLDIDNIEIVATSTADTTAPLITVTAPANGAAYTLNQVVVADYSCADIDDTCTASGTAPNGSSIDTASVGPKTFTVTAVDSHGNPAMPVMVAYTVAYTLSPLYDQTKSHKSGSTVPIKLQLVDANNTNVSSSVVVVHAVSVAKVATSAPGSLDDSGNANPDHNFRYDATLGGYIFNLSLNGYSTGTYALHFTAGDDPTDHSVQFQVK